MAAGATAPLFQPRCLERGRNRTLQAHLAPGPAFKAELLGRSFGRCRVDGGLRRRGSDQTQTGRLVPVHKIALDDVAGNLDLRHPVDLTLHGV